MKFIIILTVCLLEIASTQCQLLGGWSPVSVDDPTVKQLAGAAVEDRNNNSNNDYYSKLIDITQAQSQVVSGMKYEISFRTGATDCPRSVSCTKACQVLANESPESCTYTFFVPLGNRQPEILSSSCSYNRFSNTN